AGDIAAYASATMFPMSCATTEVRSYPRLVTTARRSLACVFFCRSRFLVSRSVQFRGDRELQPCGLSSGPQLAAPKNHCSPHFHAPEQQRDPSLPNAQKSPRPPDCGLSQHGNLLVTMEGFGQSLLQLITKW